MTYKGRNDLGIIAALVVTTAAVLYAGNYWIGGPLAVMLALCMLPQSYTAAADGLHIRAGLAQRFIPYGVITFVGPCSGGRNLALALDGVCLRYGLNSEVRIAPKDAAAFMAEVAGRTPQLVRQGHDWMLELL